MHSQATTVGAYLDGLDPARRGQMQRTLDVVRPVLPDGLDEDMDYGMISWTIPLSRVPDTYNGKPMSFAALASQKQHISLYLMPLYAGVPLTEEQFRSRWTAPKKPNLGRSCLRFTNLADIDVDLVQEVLSAVTVDDFVAAYNQVRVARRT